MTHPLFDDSHEELPEPLAAFLKNEKQYWGGNILKPGPNQSKLPVSPDGGAIRGAFWGSFFMFLFLSAAYVGWHWKEVMTWLTLHQW